MSQKFFENFVSHLYHLNRNFITNNHTYQPVPGIFVCFVEFRKKLQITRAVLQKLLMTNNKIFINYTYFQIDSTLKFPSQKT